MPRSRMPTVLAQLHGNPRKRRPPASEPRPPSGAPVAPSHLSAGAAHVWPQVAAMLNAMGVLTTADGLAMEGLCEAISDLRAARASLARPVKHGRNTIAAAGSLTYTTVGKSGQPMIRSRPEVAQAADADRRVALWLSRFGLTPADRSRVGRMLAPGDLGQFSSPVLNVFDAPMATKPPMTLDEYLASDPDAPGNMARQSPAPRSRRTRVR